MRLACLVAVLLVLPPHKPAGGHDWYEGLRSPRGDLCCSRADCRPVPYRVNARTGMEEIQVDARWWPVDPRQVLTSSAPDGRVHACWSAYLRYPSDSKRSIPRVRCIILPRMSGLDDIGVG